MSSTTLEVVRHHQRHHRRDHACERSRAGKVTGLALSVLHDEHRLDRPLAQPARRRWPDWQNGILFAVNCSASTSICLSAKNRRKMKAVEKGVEKFEAKEEAKSAS
jgi:hypothetical protein